MKTYKKPDAGIILLIVFIVSTVILLIINFFNLAPDYTRLVIVYIWLTELLFLIGYVCLFHNIKQFVSKR